MKRGYMTRQELCDSIYRAVGRATKPLSRLEICRAIGRNKSPHIIDMIEELTTGGWLQKAQDADKWGRPVLVYSVGKNIGEACADKS